MAGNMLNPLQHVSKITVHLQGVPFTGAHMGSLLVVADCPPVPVAGVWAWTLACGARLINVGRQPVMVSATTVLPNGRTGETPETAIGPLMLVPGEAFTLPGPQQGLEWLVVDLTQGQLRSAAWIGLAIFGLAGVGSAASLVWLIRLMVRADRPRRAASR